LPSLRNLVTKTSESNTTETGIETEIWKMEEKWLIMAKSQGAPRKLFSTRNCFHGVLPPEHVLMVLAAVEAGTTVVAMPK
jgi:hypothetical protein